MGYSAPDIASTGVEALRNVAEEPPDLVLMDIMLPGEMDGVTTAEQIKGRFGIPVIYVTAYADEDTLQRAKLTEPYGYVVKPFGERELHIAIDMALYKHAMERRLMETEKWFSTTLRSIGDAVIATDRDGRIAFMNPVAERLLGWKTSEVSNRDLTDVFNIVDMHSRMPSVNPVTRVLGEGNVVSPPGTLLIVRDGTEIPIDDSAAPIKDDNDNITGVVLVFRDVTERQRAEDALRKSEERYRELAGELRDSDYRKNEFIASLSHELRNPLASIGISLSVLERAKPGGDHAKRSMEIIKRQVRQLSHLVDDLLDLTRIVRNKIQLHLERIELNELVQQTLEDHHSLFETNGIHLEAEFTPSPIYLNADRARLVQVVGNLLQNAVKFTGRGGKTRVSLENAASQRRAIIRVTDTGIGMAPELISRLFRPFIQADMSLDRSKGGLGLGLALSKGLVELHGGEISAYSAGVGKGSEFTLYLSLADNPHDSPDVSSPCTPLHSRRVLIIDDNADIAESLRDLLSLNGHEVAVACSGPEGIARARDFRPEILLCDIGLPRMNGYDVARSFREDADLKNVFLVAMTGYASREDVRRAVDAGFDCHLAKPVDLVELNRTMAQFPNR